MNLSYTISRWEGDVAFLRIEQQNDPNDASNIITYWFVAQVTQAGLVADMDFRDGVSGPYWTEPTNLEVADFLAHPGVGGALFQRANY